MAQTTRLGEEMRDALQHGYEYTGLPIRIKIEGDVKDALTFRNWKIELFDLTAEMTWNGKHRLTAIG